MQSRLPVDLRQALCDAQRHAFFAQLAAYSADPPRQVRFVIALRKDFLPRLDEARTANLNLLADAYLGVRLAVIWALTPLDRWTLAVRSLGESRGGAAPSGVATATTRVLARLRNSTANADGNEWCARLGG